MPRAIWSGSITFGLVSIPIRLHTAVREHKIHFHHLAPDGSRVKYKRVSEKSGGEVDTTRWKPQRYHDTYEEQLHDVIGAKKKGKVIEVEEEEPSAKVLDLMEALQASVESAGGRKQASKRPAKKKAAKRRPAKKKAAARKSA